jgi:hypothetical protein
LQTEESRELRSELVNGWTEYDNSGHTPFRLPQEKIMPAQTEYSPDFQRFLQLVDKSLVQAAADARELAERTGTPLVVRDVREHQTRKAGRKPRRQLAR